MTRIIQGPLWIFP